MPYTELPNSSYMDFSSWRSGATAPTGGTPVAAFTLNVAIILERANDPTALLEAGWASRQQQLDALNDSGTLWSTYGADTANYNQVLTDLAALGIPTVDQVDSANGYVSSAESRTIWVQVDHTNFSTLFGPSAVLMQRGTDQWHWTGNLSLPDGWADSLGVSGLWFDTDNFAPILPDPGSGTAASLPQGWQSAGNASRAPADIFPGQIADAYYNFPFTGDLWDPASGIAPATGAIALVEPGVGTTVPSGSFGDLLDQYRAAAGITTPADWVAVAPGGQNYPTGIVPPAFNPAGERSLDIGVVTAINPQSPLLVYAGSGYNAGAHSNAYTAYQSAFWDLAYNPAVVTSSFGYAQQTAPGSPFYFAARELFVDAALRNITVFSDNGDGGSGDMFANGLTNVSTSRTSPFGIMVGGTAFSTLDSATADETLAGIVTAALAGDPATLWQLVAGGLTSLPGSAAGNAALIETVWNNYYVQGATIGTPGGHHTGYLHNNTTSGGVDPSQPPPWYQTAFGLTPTTSDPSALVGRGTPDVSANAGGNMHYLVPGPTMEGLQADSGTSASTPLWAALASQINTIFLDQGLPNLGYANDLLYIAAAIAPGAFNDVTLGSNTSSFVKGGSFTSDGQAITPTGYGYAAAPGYDLTTGLGSPNGVLLARALTAIAHSQMSGSSPVMLDDDGTGGWQSGAQQSLLFQTMSAGGAAVDVGLGMGGFGFDSGASSAFAWTNRFAQQVLQADFDSNLVRLFDKQGQGWVGQSSVASGQELSVSINGASAQAAQGSLSSPFGFADFVSGDGAVRVARPVAVAETVDGADNQTAVVRVRQNGEDSLSLTFYRVDDFSGAIAGIRPGEAGYALAAEGRAYQIGSGGTAMGGPGYGNYQQTTLLGVNAGDLIAMKLFNNDSGATFWAFAQANEAVGGQDVGHLWSYGLNTWGWEDTWGGGDRDFNDFIVQLDFTSAYGHGWLV
jgi:hypothetical protein